MKVLIHTAVLVMVCLAAAWGCRPRRSRRPPRRPSLRAERRVRSAIVLLAGALLAACLPAFAAEPVQLYREQCAACHGADRLGGTGPALLPRTSSTCASPRR